MNFSVKTINQFYLFVQFYSAMSTSKHRDDLGPVTRNRSSSANEASKPISMLQRRQTHVGAKPLNFSPSNGKYPIEKNRIKILITYTYTVSAYVWVVILGRVWYPAIARFTFDYLITLSLSHFCYFNCTKRPIPR